MVIADIEWCGSACGADGIELLLSNASVKNADSRVKKGVEITQGSDYSG